ncbi:SMP-30/gluconolactonase/LRE family protein [Alkalibacterium sp. MB6]|uniref:SMP-30/gluconolactonase/LRE family protein n=1 Tax=Alkalibacterium sp. MB6 TaxID=2081965 RepID=UPI001379BF62|nr:SMP-30/gluconolactonase/LRE family protein [Alkalibacterium sp. MB6]
MSQELKPKLVYYAGNKLLEGPVWDDKANVLYFVSIADNIIYRFDEETTEIESYPTNGPVGAAVLNEDGQLISAEKEGIYSINPETKERTFLLQANKDERMRYNDGKMDPKGRFLIGTMGYEEVIEGAAKLFVVEDDDVKEILSDMSIANGLGWSKDGQTFYHIDTPTNKVRAFDYNLDTAELSNERVVVEITDGGSPDGMCVDVDENIWVAEYGGKRICKWDTKTVEQLVDIPMPVSNITSCCLGGPDKNYLYITTAQEDGEPLSGGLFKVKIR